MIATQENFALEFGRGHGTENDFVIVPDEHAQLSISPDRVRALCDRRAGIGGDGLLRVARAGALVESGEVSVLAPGIADHDWFMDYRNADGSVAQMCGNGVRVFAHWLVAQKLIDVPAGQHWTVGTRAGAKQVVVHEATSDAATVSVHMGLPRVTGLSTVRMAGRRYAGLGVDMGNPHLAAVVPGLDAAGLHELELAQPDYDPEFFPEGVNVEIVTPLRSDDDGRNAVSMRVYERGVGETKSCGTGTVAAACAALADAGAGEGEVIVHVPGGRVHVAITAKDAVLTGPSAIVATGKTVL